MTQKRRRSRPGPPPQAAKRAHYLRLMSQGISNGQACKEVGISRRTGTRWKYGRTVKISPGTTAYYPPISPTLAPKQYSARYLSQEERITIADGLRARDTQCKIAARLGRSPSTISREIRRNTDPETGRYTPFSAHRQMGERRQRPKERVLVANDDLREYVLAGLGNRWSPEQISNRLAQEYPSRPEMRVSPETIYQTLYDHGSEGLSRTLTINLRTGRRLRKPRRKGKRRHRGFLSEEVMIGQRPTEIDDREVVGHWEGDLIVGSHHQSAIGTLVERVTRFTVLVFFEGQHSSEAMREGLRLAFDDMPSVLKGSLTWDQGVEMAKHAEFTMETKMPVFFCERSSPWQRGTNENTNGLLRQYFPKHTDLNVYGRDDLVRVAAELNDRPRKVLGWWSPAECVARVLDDVGVATFP